MRLKTFKLIRYLLWAAAAILVLVLAITRLDLFLWLVAGWALAYAAFELAFWRCPDCGRWLGREKRIAYCPYCGKELDI